MPHGDPLLDKGGDGRPSPASHCEADWQRGGTARLVPLCPENPVTQPPGSRRAPAIFTGFTAPRTTRADMVAMFVGGSGLGIRRG